MAHREDTLNRRLGLLTILSAIFMPLTLLSGIWGMNFESMPELSMQGAYQVRFFVSCTCFESFETLTIINFMHNCILIYFNKIPCRKHYLACLCFRCVYSIHFIDLGGQINKGRQIVTDLN